LVQTELYKLFNNWGRISQSEGLGDAQTKLAAFQVVP